MKIRLFKLMAVLALLFTPIPIQSQNYLKIWFKDGHTERHFMNLIRHISATKYDLEGNLHPDYQMQQIVMPDTTYSYYIADIDSMSFRKVDEEQVKLNILDVTSTIDPIFNKCKTIEEMEQHINEIESIKGVENVEISETAIIVTVRDWYNIFYLFPPDLERTDNYSNTSGNYTNSLPTRSNRKTAELIGKIDANSKGTPVNIAFVNQMSNNENASLVQEDFEEATKWFNNPNYNVKIFKSEEVNTTFYEQTIFDYDIVILFTHGIYAKGKHWLLTGTEVEEPSMSFMDNLFNDFYVKNDLDVLGCAKTKEKRSGKNTSIWYQAVSESFIDASTFQFDGKRKTIIYNGACSSLKGKKTLERHLNGKDEKFSGDDSMAQILLNKGADVYLGYNQDAIHGWKGGCSFLKLLLNGFSLEQAINLMPSNLIDEESCYNNQWNPAHLIDIGESSEYRSMFIVDTQTLDLSKDEIEREYSQNGQITIKGATSSLETKDSGKPYVICGFLIKIGPDIYKVEDENLLKYYNNPSENKIVFSYTIDQNLKPGTKIYYRAYTRDDFNVNYGNECDLDIPKYHKLSLELNSITVSALTSSSVQITSGSGSYSIESIIPSGIVTASIFDNKSVAIEANTPGTAVITVKDNITGETATITVTVTGIVDNRELMFTKTVGSAVYSVYKKTLSESDYHTNPDGWKCYRSELSLDITKNGNTNTYVVDNNIYLDKNYDHHGGQQPCMLLDFNKNMMYIFCNSKDDGPYYSMDGNFYSSSMNNIHFSKETVFEGANWGWYPYFCDYGDDNIYLCNFSFAGYFTIMAVRESNTWELYYYNTDISPEQATREWEIAGPVLVIGNPEEEIDEPIPS